MTIWMGWLTSPGCRRSLDELVHEDKNGLIFSSSTQLAEQWMVSLTWGYQKTFLY